MRRVAALLVPALLAGCGRPAADGPINVSVIGPAIDAVPVATVADRRPPGAPAAVLIGATQQGLIRFDAGGQVIPGLATRWAVSDDGTSLLFRTAGDDPTAAAAAAARIRAAIAPASRNPLRPLLGAIRSAAAVTPEVVDVELAAPRPNLLSLFAQPALGIAAGAHGSGPFRLRRLRAGVAVLQQLPDRDADPDEPPPPPPLVRVRGERAGVAVARFSAGRAALVLGGSFADLAVARAATLPPDTLRVDPTPGLFGLAFAAGATGFLADAANRAALSAAVDRDRIGAALAAPGWASQVAIVPVGLPELAAPATPDWATLPPGERRARAAAVVAAWRGGGRAVPPLRVGMPAGPGARLVWALVAADWRAIGVDAVAVGAGEPADLRLVDEVAPADTAAFYLRAFACDQGVVCTAEADAALIAARAAPTLAERAALLAQADALIAATVPFIPLGSPVRWSLAAATLDRFRESPRGIHPLDELRSPSVR